MAERQQLETIGARLDQLITLVRGKVSDRLDQLAAGLGAVQDRLTQLEERLAQFQADLNEAAIWPVEEEPEEVPEDWTPGPPDEDSVVEPTSEDG